ncbi:MAG TPA: hypothetical protein PKM65_06790 [Spirochaetota bacterium]|nr:hypothetical protein [Spirochaetota bacterium]HNT09935.1 hypothetical protein [Spirochaetota bacterium]
MKQSIIMHCAVPVIVVLTFLSMLIVCADHDTRDGGQDSRAVADAENAIGGSVSGLSGSLVLQNNNGDDLTIRGDGPFKFATPIQRGGEYRVTIRKQPDGPECGIYNASGTALSEVTDIVVVCSYKSYPVRVTVRGLAGKLTLANNGIDTLEIDSDGSHVFNLPIVKGGRYRVTVDSKPTIQSCTVNNAEGPVNGPVELDVNCSTISYKISGTVRGLKEGSIILQNNAGDDILMDANGNFTFHDPVVKDSNYSVTIRSQPGIRPCRVINGGGKATRDVTNVSVLCSYRVVLYSAGLYNGDMGGPDGTDAKCAAMGNVSGLDAPYTAFICKSGSVSVHTMPEVYGIPKHLPVTTPGGALIAQNWEDLVNGKLRMSLETLVDQGSKNTTFWSGCDATGNYKANAKNCGNFYSYIFPPGPIPATWVPAWKTTIDDQRAASKGWTGSMMLTGNGWLSQREIACTQNAYLLCAAYGPEPASVLTAYLRFPPSHSASLLAIMIGVVGIALAAIVVIVIVRKSRST